MRIPLDYVTFSVIGLSVISLTSTMLQFAHLPVSSEALYPLRMNLTDIVVAQDGSANYASQASGMAEDLATIGNADAMQTDAPAFGLSEKNLATRALASELGNGSANAASANSPRSFTNVLAVQYDLGSQSGSTDGMSVQTSTALAGLLDVRKRIRVGKAAPTKIDVKVGSSANIYVNAAQLSSILQSQGKKLNSVSGADRDGFVSLEDLRNSGFVVRYDAVGDALVVDGEV